VTLNTGHEILASLQYFPKKQTATLRREGKREYFSAEGVAFASQFGESGFDISLSQQVLSAIVAGASCSTVSKALVKQTNNIFQCLYF